MLYSYLINPTHGSHILPDVTARFTDRALPHASKTPSDAEISNLLPEAANAVHRLSGILRSQIESAHLTHIYETMDLPLVSVLLRMEQVGVRIDSAVLGEMSTRLAVDMDNLAERIYAQAGAAMGAAAGHRFHI